MPVGVLRLLVIGAYPPGRSGMCGAARPRDRPEALDAIKRVPLPETIRSMARTARSSRGGVRQHDRAAAPITHRRVSPRRRGKRDSREARKARSARWRRWPAVSPKSGSAPERRIAWLIDSARP